MAEFYDTENTLQQWQNFVSIMVELYHKTNLQQKQNFTIGKYLTAMGELCFNNSRNLPVKNNLTTRVW